MNDVDAMTQTRLDVAEIKGMLAALVASHAQRIEVAERRLDAHENRLNEKKSTIARHDERIQDLEDDNTGRWGRNIGVISVCISGLALFLTWVVPALAQ